METPQDGDEADTVININEPDQIVTTEQAPDKKKAADHGDSQLDPNVNDEGEREERETAERREGGRTRAETDEDYSRRVQGRINRERALRLKSDRKVDNLTAQNTEMRERLAKLERAQNAESITNDAKKSITEINAKIEATKVKLAAAIEAGDTKLQLDINIELSELVADKKIIERRSEYQAEQVRKAADAPKAQEAGEEEESAEEKRVREATTRWQQENRKWWNLNRFRDVRQDAIQMDIDLRREVSKGEVDFEEYSDEYFTELSLRLKQNYPDLDVRGMDGEAIEEDPESVESRTNRDERASRRDQRPAPRRPAAGGMGTSDRRRGAGDALSMARNGNVRLSKPDFAQMREYGLDPNDKTHRERFAKERMRTILTDAQPGRGGGR